MRSRVSIPGFFLSRPYKFFVTAISRFDRSLPRFAKTKVASSSCIRRLVTMLGRAPRIALGCRVPISIQSRQSLKDSTRRRKIEDGYSETRFKRPGESVSDSSRLGRK